MTPMDLTKKPYGAMALRIKWHREIVMGNITQEEYGQRIGVSRTVVGNWENGDNRLSLNGALALREEFGLSLDFLFLGIDDALPMTLRNAWRERPADKS